MGFTSAYSYESTLLHYTKASAYKCSLQIYINTERKVEIHVSGIKRAPGRLRIKQQTYNFDPMCFKIALYRYYTIPLMPDGLLFD